MTVLPTQTEIQEGEHLLDSWKPNLMAFSQRAILLALATEFAIGVAGNWAGFRWFGDLGWWQWLVALPFITVAYVFVFDDVTNWMRHRDDRWHLTSLRLIYENVSAPEEDAAVYLSDIDSLHVWFWWGLRVNLSSGQATAMKYMHRPRVIRRHIQSAIAALETPNA